MRIINGWQLPHADNVIVTANDASALTKEYLLSDNLKEALGDMIFFYDQSHYGYGVFDDDLLTLSRGIFTESVTPHDLNLKECWMFAEDRFEQMMTVGTNKGNMVLDFYTHPIRGGAYVLLTGEERAIDLFAAKYGPRYYYWDDAEMREDMNPDEWSYRGDTWRKVLGYPEANQSLRYSILRDDQVLPRVSTLATLSEAPGVPSVYLRATRLVMSVVAKQYFDKEPINKADPEYTKYYYSPATEKLKDSLFREFSDTMREISYKEITDKIC